MENRAPEYAVVCRRALEQKIPLEEAEAETFGKDHTRITRFLLELWGMPATVCRAVTNHLEPGRHPEETELNLTTVLYVANHLARAQNPPDRFVTPPLNHDYLNAVGFCTRNLPLPNQPTAPVEAALQPH
jgi:HD-like signal output (HDOD) protein